MAVAVKRIYEPASKSDGTRVLVDRLWPRGMSKRAARIDRWMKEIAPSAALRQWFNHDPKKWPEFKRRYRRELAGNRELLAELRKMAASGRLSLVYSARDERHNQAVALREILARGRRTGK